MVSWVRILQPARPAPRPDLPFALQDSEALAPALAGRRRAIPADAHLSVATRAPARHVHRQLQQPGLHSQWKPRAGAVRTPPALRAAVECEPAQLPLLVPLDLASRWSCSGAGEKVLLHLSY